MAPENVVGASYRRLVRQRYFLEGESCPNCERKIFPPRDICPDCGVLTTNDPDNRFKFSGKGEVFSFTTIYEAPIGFTGNAPYTIALIKLAEGPMLTAQLTDVDLADIHIGMPVEMVTRRMGALPGDKNEDGIIPYGYKFRPPISS